MNSQISLVIKVVVVVVIIVPLASVYLVIDFVWMLAVIFLHTYVLTYMCTYIFRGAASAGRQ